MNTSQPLNVRSAFVLVAMWAAHLPADDLPNSPRVTPLVRVIHGMENSVVSLFCLTGPNEMINGSGAIVHSDGFVLTNSHVLPKNDGFALIGERGPFRFDVVGRLPEQDLAIVKLRDVSGITPIPLGLSNDLYNGEPVVVAGNPGGRGIVFTAGVVSSRRFLSGGPNALVMSQFENSGRETFIQFDAASNRGNSGGPLVNMEGRLIGVVSALITNEQNSGLAIPIDRARRFFERVIEPETRNALSTGLDVVNRGGRAVIHSVAADSAAANSGLRPGDVIISLNQKPVRYRLDYLLLLHSALSEGGKLELDVERLGERKSFPFQADPIGFAPPVERETTEPGLTYRFYHGRHQRVPDFEALKPDREGVVPAVDLDAIRQDRPQDFSVLLEGLLRIPDDGVYRIVVISDDGSVVHVDGEPAILNDGNHPPKEASRLLRLSKGLHPIRIGYFQGIGGHALELHIENEAGQRKAVGADMLFH